METLVSSVFDAVIALLAAGIPLFILDVRLRWDTLQARGFCVFACAALAAVWCAVSYGSFIEPRTLVTRTYQVSIGDSNTELRVAVVSDFHLGLFKHEDWTRRVVREINRTAPDLVILAGDFVSAKSGMESLAPLREISAKYGVFAVLGNWDYRVGAVDVRHAIERYGVEVLTNESVGLEVGDQVVRLIGIDDIKNGLPDWEASLAGTEDSDVTILASHNPDAAPVAEYNGIGLVVSGHTHGGQVRLPLFGAVPPLPTVIDQSFDKGLFWFGPTRLFITPGVGEVLSRARLFDPPEVSVLDITF